MFCKSNAGSSLPGAVLHDPGVIAARCVELARTGTVQDVDGNRVEMPARSLCIHGDNPSSVATAQAIRAALEREGVAIQAF